MSKKKEVIKMERVVITNAFVGFCHMQVCAVSDATDEEILLVCNSQNPSGTSNGWTMVLRDGEGGPVACEQEPGRMHFLAVC
jgi:hypothetical protein